MHNLTSTSDCAPPPPHQSSSQVDFGHFKKTVIAYSKKGGARNRHHDHDQFSDWTSDSGGSFSGSSDEFSSSDGGGHHSHSRRSSGVHESLLREACEAFAALKRSKGRGFSLEKTFQRQEGGAASSSAGGSASAPPVGTVTSHDFMKVLTKVGFKMNKRSLKKIAQQLEKVTSRTHGKGSGGGMGVRGRIDYKAFILLLRRGVQPGAGKHQSHRHGHRGGGDMSDYTDEDAGLIDMEELKKKLRGMIATATKRGMDMQQMFDLLDQDKSGGIDRHEFQKAAELLGCSVSSGEAKALVVGLDGGKHGDTDRQVDFYEFMEFVEHEDTQKDQEIDAVEERVRNLLRAEATRRSSSGKEKLDMKSLFKKFSNDSDSISRKDFYRCLRKLTGNRTDLTFPDVRALVKRFDKDGDGHIAYREFVSLLTLDPVSIDDLAARLRRRLLDHQRKTGRSHLETFRLVDKDGSGLLGRSEFKQALRDTGIVLQDREVAKLLDRFDSDGDGKVDYKDFCKFVSPSAADLTEEERVVRQKIREAGFARGGVADRVDDPDLRRAFHLDTATTDRLGIMTPAQFQQALDFLGVNLGTIELEALVSRFDTNADGMVDARAFATFADFGIDEIKELAERLRVRGGQMKRDGLPQLEDQFRELDDRVGAVGTSRVVRVIQRSEFEAVLRQMGMPLSEVELYALAHRHSLPEDPDHVVYGDFCEFVIAGKKAVEAFERRGKYARGKVTSQLSEIETKQPTDDEVYVGAPRSLERGFRPFAAFLRPPAAGGYGLSSPLHLSMVDAELNSSNLHRTSVEDWLENEASRRERNMYRDLMRSVEVFAEEKQSLNGSALLNSSGVGWKQKGWRTGGTGRKGTGGAGSGWHTRSAMRGGVTTPLRSARSPTRSSRRVTMASTAPVGARSNSWRVHGWQCPVCFYDHQRPKERSLKECLMCRSRNPNAYPNAYPVNTDVVWGELSQPRIGRVSDDVYDDDDRGSLPPRSPRRGVSPRRGGSPRRSRQQYSDDDDLWVASARSTSRKELF